MLDRYVFGEITNGGFPPALQDRIVAAVLKINAHPLDPAAHREAEAVGRDMLRHQGEHAAFGMLKRVHSQPGGIDLAALAKGSEAAPLSSGLASEPDRESVRLVAPDWIAPGSEWELPANAPTVEGGARLVAVVGADRTAVVSASFAIALLSSWASARAEPVDPGGGYRHRDPIRVADPADAGVHAQDDRRGARSPSSEDWRPGGDPYGEDHRQ